MGFKSSKISLEGDTKNNLDSVLGESGLSLPEWLDVQILEEVSRQGHLFGSPGILATAALDRPSDVVKSLKRIDWAFESATTDYLSHDIHPYPAKFIPQIPRCLVASLSYAGDLVWDPFGGSGTTALEAILLGRRCISSDANPLTCVIGRAKTLALTLEQERRCAELLEELRALAFDQDGLAALLDATNGRWHLHVPDIPNCDKWFHKNAVEELAYIRWRIAETEDEDCKTLYATAFSRSILRSSFQDSETRYVAKERSFTRCEVLRIFCTHLQAALKKARTLAPHVRFRAAEFRQIDLRKSLSDGGSIRADSVDLIVTSPPYPNATDYHLYHRFRMFWLGYEPRELANQEIGSHLRNQKARLNFADYLREMKACLTNMHFALRPGRYAVLVLGNALFEAKEYKTAEEIGCVAKQAGFELTGIIDRPVHATRRSFVSSARRLRTEQLVVLRKPAAVERIHIEPASYRLWAYEDELRRREIVSLLRDATVTERDGRMDIESPTQEQIALLRRLTFSHRYHGAQYGEEVTWQAVLENGDAHKPSRRKDPKYATHGLHPYKGKFYPQLAKSLFNVAGLNANAAILDPFCGSGTVLLEASLNGFRSTGVDVNPLAVAIARAKTQAIHVEPELRDRILAAFRSRIECLKPDLRHLSIFPNEALPELESWFPRPVLVKLASILREIECTGNQAIQDLLKVLVSSIVREISQQEPKDLRIRRRKHPIDDAPVFSLLETRIEETRERLRKLARVSNRAPALYQRSEVLLGDIKDGATLRQSLLLSEGRVDAVVTSPPYATALPYIDTDRLSLLLLFGLNSSDRQPLESSLIGNREIRSSRRKEIEARIERGDWVDLPSSLGRGIVLQILSANRSSSVGFRRQNMAALMYLYFSEMTSAMKNIDSVLRPRGDAFFVIGDNRTEAGGRDVVIRSGDVLREIGQTLGWSVKDVIPITVTKEDLLHNRNSITENVIIHFKKPD